MQEAAAELVEYVPAVQFVHLLSAVVEARRDWPGTHCVALGVHSVAFAADQLTPAVQLPHTALVEAAQVEARNLPAAQTLEEQLEHGAKPVADQVTPSTQGATDSQASEVAFHL